MTYKRLTPFSTTSGAYYRGDSPRELEGRGEEGGGFSVLVCLRSVYELRGLCEHMYAKLFTYASVKKKKTFLFNLVFFLFVILTFVSS